MALRHRHLEERREERRWKDKMGSKPRPEAGPTPRDALTCAGLQMAPTQGSHTATNASGVLTGLPSRRGRMWQMPQENQPVSTCETSSGLPGIPGEEEGDMDLAGCVTLGHYIVSMKGFSKGKKEMTEGRKEEASQGRGGEGRRGRDRKGGKRRRKPSCLFNLVMGTKPLPTPNNGPERFNFSSFLLTRAKEVVMRLFIPLKKHCGNKSLS